MLLILHISNLQKKIKIMITQYQVLRFSADSYKKNKKTYMLINFLISFRIYY